MKIEIAHRGLFFTRQRFKPLQSMAIASATIVTKDVHCDRGNVDSLTNSHPMVNNVELVRKLSVCVTGGIGRRARFRF
jgi:hypothetical protein